MFHMYVGVRAGGGIGDEIDDPAGDEFEMERMVFDITFFFFVIVILLAIIQGELDTRTLSLPRHKFHSIHLVWLESIWFVHVEMKRSRVSVCSTQLNTCHSKSSHAHTKLPTKRHIDSDNYGLILGLIIDAFGELRDQQEQVKEDMEVRWDTFSSTQTLWTTQEKLQKWEESLTSYFLYLCHKGFTLASPF